MRTYTVVPSFEGESAYFELPDIGFQGDNLSFAILFNLTELIEHWPNIVPSMIVTDSKNDTYIAPCTSWNGETHIFTWAISSTETAYDGVIKCQLKCLSEDDPDTIVCMSQICQTRVYQSLDAASDPPEAFQNWIDELVRLGAEVNADANVVLAGVETTETNARAAQAAADAAELAKNAAESARMSVENTAAIAISAQEGATQAQQRANNAAIAAETAKGQAEAARDAAQTALEEVDRQAVIVDTNKAAAIAAAERAALSEQNALSAKTDAESARDDAVAAKGQAITARTGAETAADNANEAYRNAATAQQAAETAQGLAEDAQQAAETAQGLAEDAQQAAETAQGLAEDAQQAAETAQSLAEDAQQAAETAQGLSEDYANTSSKWAVGKHLTGTPVDQNDETYNNSSAYWAERAHQEAIYTFGYLTEIERKVGIVKSLVFTIRPQDWVEFENGGSFSHYFDITDEFINNRQIPFIVLDEESLEIAFYSRVCTTIRSFAGYVRIKTVDKPASPITGMLYLFGEGINASEYLPPDVEIGDVGLATNSEVDDMITDVFTENMNSGENGATIVTDHELATNEEVDDMLNDVFSENR